MQKPDPGWSTSAEVVRVIDGDTVVVEIRRQINVRLLDCWCPESRTKNKKEKQAGLAAKRFVVDLLKKVGSTVTLFIPADPFLNVSHEFTLGRVLGRLWLSSGKELSKEIVDAGHGTTEKQLQ